jgi:hypothetical protein
MLLMLAQLMPAEAIEHQKHHLVSTLHTRRHPLWYFLSSSRSEKGGNQTYN